MITSFQKAYQAEFFAAFDNERKLKLSLQRLALMNLERELYFGIYGVEPPE